MVPSFLSRPVGIMVRTSRHPDESGPSVGTIGTRSFTIKSMFYVYILELSNRKYYTGQTKDVALRIIRHQTGQVRSTKGFRPVKLIYSEDVTTRSDAMKREKYLKSLKSNKALREIIQSGDGPIV